MSPLEDAIGEARELTARPRRAWKEREQRSDAYVHREPRFEGAKLRREVKRRCADELERTVGVSWTQLKKHVDVLATLLEERRIEDRANQIITKFARAIAGERPLRGVRRAVKDAVALVAELDPITTRGAARNLVRFHVAPLHPVGRASIARLRALAWVAALDRWEAPRRAGEREDDERAHLVRRLATLDVFGVGLHAVDSGQLRQHRQLTVREIAIVSILLNLNGNAWPSGESTVGRVNHAGDERHPQRLGAPRARCAAYCKVRSTRSRKRRFLLVALGLEDVAPAIRRRPHGVFSMTPGTAQNLSHARGPRRRPTVHRPPEGGG